MAVLLASRVIKLGIIHVHPTNIDPFCFVMKRDEHVLIKFLPSDQRNRSTFCE